MTRFSSFGTTSSCVLVSSLLLLSGAAVQATGDHHHKNNNNNNNNNNVAAGTQDHHDIKERAWHQVRHSPFKVSDSTELNRALAILEHESQNWHHIHDKTWWDWADEEEFESVGLGKTNEIGNVNTKAGHHDKNNNNNNNRATAQNRNNRKNKHDHDKIQREFFYGRIEIVKKGDYYLDREFIFADGFKLILQGLHQEEDKKEHHHQHLHKGKHSSDYHGDEYYSVGSASASEKMERVVIHAAKDQRHFIFDDHAILKASDVSFVDGGCEKEGFFGGSILFVNRAAGFFERVIFRDNKAWVGGAIFAENAALLDFHESKFIKNHAERKGGAVAIEEEREREHKKENKWAAKNAKKNNKNNNKNRQLYYEVEDEDLVSTTDTRNNNQKNKNLHNHKDKARRTSRVHFFKVVFFKNSADLGGALFNAGSHTDVVKSHFTSNHARLGGAVFNSHRGRLLVRDSSFRDNKATAKGGAIFNAGRLWILCSRFVGNGAPIAKDIFNNGELKCTASTELVHVEGHGEGYCHACVQAATAEPTMRGTPKRRVKKALYKHDKKDDKKDGGLLGALFAGKKEEAAEGNFVYDYYGSGPSVYDRWNGYYGAGTKETGNKKNYYYYSDSSKDSASSGSGSDYGWDDDYYKQGGGDSYGSNWSYDGDW